MRARNLAIAAGFFLVAGMLHAYDFGGFLDNSSGYLTTGAPSFEQSNKLGLWFDTHIGPHLFFDVQASGDYQNQQSYGGGYLLPYANLDLLSLQGQFAQVPGGASLLTFDVGRFPVKDPTGDIFDQTLDGGRVSVAYPLLSVAATAGYTGLTIKPASTIVMSKADLSGLGTTSQYFGSPRALAALVVRFPTLLFEQDLTLGVLAQQDLRPLFPGNRLVSPGQTGYSAGEGGPLDTQYFTLGVSGPIVGSLYWAGSFALESGRMLSYITSASQYEYKPIIAYLGSAAFHYYLPSLLHTAIGLSGTYASGDSDFTTFYGGNSSGYATAFIPITQKTVAAVFSPQLENIVIGRLSLSVKPLSHFRNVNVANLQTKVEAIPFLRPTDGPVSAPGVVDGNHRYYLGTEIDGVVNYRPFSDLGISLSGGVFFPNDAAFTPSARRLQYGARAEASFSF